ncbi:MAG: four helix bundle protein [Candidatus Omnitrophica bacterium]|nr:four helix bundle protein [Candidatus Omnitrophota bacterium]MBU1127976.1 four helix bundle protein [Candidatus Omnitrophota bacterium]MBU1784615.1 four helix bundle protein [Candidatus Omnitrophota bacterium]MBU1852014.1 four helix bundle protein [Candidatus Omnitrophota bacterium]
MKTHKDLNAWQKSMDFAEKIYKLTENFPADERFGLVSQLRRAAVSVVSNIAEGAGRYSSREFAQFLYIALASTSEIETQIILAERLGYFKLGSKDILNDLETVRKLLSGLIKSVKTKIN